MLQGVVKQRQTQHRFVTNKILCPISSENKTRDTKCFVPTGNSWWTEPCLCQRYDVTIGYHLCKNGLREEDVLSSLFWEAFTKLRKRLLASSRLSVRPSAWNKSARTGQILIKFNIRVFFFEKIQASLQSDKNNWYFTWRRFHIIKICR